MPITRPGLRTWLILAVTTLFLAISSASAVAADTTIYVVRHADRDGEKDALKDPEGFARAAELARILMKGGGVDAAFATNTTRTKQTAAPTVAAAGLDRALAYSGSGDIKGKIFPKFAGKRVLVVGHSNTVRDIVVALGLKKEADKIPAVLPGFDALFIVRLTDGKPTLEITKY